MRKQALKTWRHQHDFLLNYVLMNPFASLKELSKVTGFTLSWLSTVINGKLFQARLRAAMPQIYSIPIEEFHNELVKRSIQYGRENIKTPKDYIPRQ